VTSETIPPGRRPRARRLNTRCQVCRSEHRWRVEALHCAGASLDSLAKRFGLSRDGIWRHAKSHISPEARASYLIGPADLENLALKAAEQGESAMDYAKVCRGVLFQQLAALGIAGDSKNVCMVVDRIMKVLEFQGRITGEVSALATSVHITNNTVAVLESPGFAKVQMVLLRALAEFPAARACVVDALRGLDSENARTGSAAPAIGKVIEHVAG
jgi:hypothetical protein